MVTEKIFWSLSFPQTERGGANRSCDNSAPNWYVRKCQSLHSHNISQRTFLRIDWTEMVAPVLQQWMVWYAYTWPGRPEEAS